MVPLYMGRANCPAPGWLNRSHQPLQVVLADALRNVPLDPGVEVEKEAVAGPLHADGAAVAGQVRAGAGQPLGLVLWPPVGRPDLGLDDDLDVGERLVEDGRPCGEASVLKAFFSSPQVLQRTVTSRLVVPWRCARRRHRSVSGARYAGGDEGSKQARPCDAGRASSGN